MTVTLISPFGTVEDDFFVTAPFVKWDRTTAIGVDLPPKLVNDPPPMHQVFTDLTAQNLIGKPVGPGWPASGNGPSLGYGVTIAQKAVQNKGKFYFEITYTQILDPSNPPYSAQTHGGIAIAQWEPTRTVYSNLAVQIVGGGAGFGGLLMDNGGQVWLNGDITNAVLPTLTDPILGPPFTLGLQNGDVIGFAVDLDASLFWCKCVNGPSMGAQGIGDDDWNGGSYGIGAGSDPTGRILGVPLLGGNLVPYAIFGGETYPQAVTITAAFGILANAPLGYRTWPPAETEQ